MKKLICLLLIGFFILPSSFARKKVAVVLSGGGAKGMAHIGALKVIEEAGIPIDIVVGTSMGSIVGGLYSIGYSPHQLDSMVNKQDWTFLLSDRLQANQQSFAQRERNKEYVLSIPFNLKTKQVLSGGLIKGENLASLFSELTIGYHDSIDFNDLPIPFACVATDLVNGSEVNFHQGLLPVAMRASMAIPGVFTPVRLDSMVLVDGGLVNNFPVNVALQMGADLVIGVDVQSNLLTANELKNAKDILGQVVNLMGQGLYDKNLKLTNVYIHPDVTGFSAASFTKSAIDTLIANGERAAREKWDDLIALKKKIGIPEDYHAQRQTEFVPFLERGDFFVKDIKFEGIKDEDEEWLLRKCGLQENTKVTVGQLQKAINVLANMPAYSNVNYVLNDGPKIYNLVFKLEKKQQNSLNLGIRFDTEEVGAILVNATTYFRGKIDSKLSLTGRIGKNLFARANFSLEPTIARNVNFAYMFRYNDIDIYSRGKRMYNTSYQYHLGEISYSDVFKKTLKIQAGIRYEFFDYSEFLYSGEGQSVNVKPEGFISYFASLNLETLDKWYFPTKGISLKFGYSLYTKNFATYDGHTPFSALDTHFTTVAKVTNRFSLLPSLYGRVLIGRHVPYPYYNTVGGYVSGRNVPQQIPFMGLNHMEIMNNSVVIAKLQMRERIGGKHYVSLIGNYGIHNNDFFRLFNGKSLWGIGASYAYDSFIGPLEATFSFSNQTKKVAFYASLGYVF